MTTIEALTAAVKDKAHSFSYLRQAAGLKLSDDQFLNLIKEHPDQFQLVRIRRKDDEGKPIRPGLPGVKVVAHA